MSFYAKTIRRIPALGFIGGVLLAFVVAIPAGLLLGEEAAAVAVVVLPVVFALHIEKRSGTLDPDFKAKPLIRIAWPTFRLPMWIFGALYLALIGVPSYFLAGFLLRLFGLAP